MLVFLKVFSASIEIIIWFLSFNLIIWCITLCHPSVLWSSLFSPYIFLFLLCLLLLSFPHLIIKPPQTTILPSCISFFLRMVLVTASFTVLQTFIHSSQLCLLDLIPLIYLSPPLYNHKGFHLDPT